MGKDGLRVALTISATVWVTIFVVVGCRLGWQGGQAGGTPPSPFSARGSLLGAVDSVSPGVQGVTAGVVIRHPASLPDIAGGLPVVVPPEGRPVAGQPFTLGWTTRPSAPFPDLPAALFVTLQGPPKPGVAPGGRGVTLQVPPDIVIVPNLEGSPLTQSGGHVSLSVGFPPSAVGVRIWAQLVVQDARVPAGWVTAPMVEILVGDR